MTLSEPVVVAIISYVGVVTGVAGNWFIAIWVAKRAATIKENFADEVERTAERNVTGPRLGNGKNHSSIADRLAFWRACAIAALLFSLAGLASIMMQPSEESRWFVGMHIEQIVFAGLVCFATLVLAGLGRPVRSVWLQGLLGFILPTFAITFGLLTSDFAHWQPLPPNEKLAQAGWYGFDHRRYDFAVAATDECIDKFGVAARRLEKNLTGIPEPPIGAVPDQARLTILQNGVLNDVATCYWIKGRAEQLRKDSEKSKLAYDSASAFNHARTWDPNQRIFWSPAQDAKDRLSDLR